MPTELTVTEAAAMKGVTPAAVRRAIQRGRLRAEVQRTPGQPKGRWLLRSEDVSAWTPARTQADKGRRRAEVAAENPEAERRAAVHAARGILAGSTRTLADFLREKHADTERER